MFVNIRAALGRALWQGLPAQAPAGLSGAGGQIQGTMVEVLQNFEQAARRISPLILIGPGLAGVLLGLFVWLGGAGFKKYLLAVVGASTGAVLGFLVIGRNALWAAALAGVAAVVAAILQRVFVAILAAALAAAITFAVLARPYAGEASAAAAAAGGTQAVILDASQSAKLIASYATEFCARAKEVCWHMPVRDWAIMMGAAMAAIVAGSCIWRVVCALCCAVLGTVFIHAGMILLLLYKGSTPISAIFNKAPFYATVFAAMAAFGAVVQLVFCRQGKRKSGRVEQAGKAGEEPQPAERNWRNS